MSTTSRRTALPAAAAAADPAAGHAPRRAPVALPALVAGVASQLYLALTLLNWWQRDAGSWDLAIFTQALQGYAHFAAPIVDLKDPGVNVLGDHFTPILAVLAPVFRVFPHPLTLQVSQVLLIGLSVFVLARTAITYLGRAGGLMVGAAYALSFGVQNAVDYDFHEVAFAAPILALVGDLYLRRRWGSAALVSLALLLVKEDLGPVVAAFGVCLFLKGARRTGALLVAAATAYLLVVVGLVIPAINPRGRYDYLAVASADGAGLLDRLGELLTPDIKLVTLVLTLVVSGFLALRSPFVLLLVPMLAERFVSPVATHWSPFYQYSLVPMVVVFVATIEVLRDASVSGTRRAEIVRRVGPPSIALVALALVPFFPLGALAAGDTWARTDRASAMDALITRIPAGATVQADDFLDQFLVADHRVFGLPVPDSPIPRRGDIGAEFIALDQSLWDQYDVDGVTRARAMNSRWDYDVVFDSHDLVLLRRTDLPAEPAGASLP